MPKDEPVITQPQQQLHDRVTHRRAPRPRDRTRSGLRLTRGDAGFVFLSSGGGAQKTFTPRGTL